MKQYGPFSQLYNGVYRIRKDSIIHRSLVKEIRPTRQRRIFMSNLETDVFFVFGWKAKELRFSATW